MDELNTYLENKEVKQLFKELLEKVCLSRPDNVHSFLVSYIQETYSTQLQTALVKYEDDDDMEEEEEEDDILPEMEEAPKAKAGGRRRRSAVSAESMNPDEIKNKPKKVVEKSDEARGRIWDKLKTNFLFSSLDGDAATDLINAVEEKTFKEGEVVMKQGDDGDFFYIIDEGQSHIFVKSGDEEEKLVLKCGPGDSFGELALMYNAPRAATVKAVSDMRCWAVDRYTFKATLMEATLSKRARYEKFLDQVPILETLYKYEKLTIADALVAVSYNEGDVVVDEGSEGDDFFIIEKGSVDYTQKTDSGEESIVGRGELGDYFGEISLLTNQPRAATVKCTSACSFLKLDRKTFVRVMGPLDDILKRNISKYKSWMEKKEEGN